MDYIDENFDIKSQEDFDYFFLKTEYVGIRMSKFEKEMLFFLAHAHNLSVSDYIRNICIFGGLNE